MTGTKYIGMDVHKESISLAVRNDAGKLVMECVIETKANVILDLPPVAIAKPCDSIRRLHMHTTTWGWRCCGSMTASPRRLSLPRPIASIPRSIRPALRNRTSGYDLKREWSPANAS